MEGRLETAKLVGADVTINCKTEDLKTRGMCHIMILCPYLPKTSCVICSPKLVLQETDGNGVGRLLEATGASRMVNNCFSLLRYTYKYHIIA